MTRLAHLRVEDLRRRRTGAGEPGWVHANPLDQALLADPAWARRSTVPVKRERFASVLSSEVREPSIGPPQWQSVTLGAIETADGRREFALVSELAWKDYGDRKTAYKVLARGPGLAPLLELAAEVSDRLAAEPETFTRDRERTVFTRDAFTDAFRR